jgi:iron complex outermembrane receptor protein
VFHDWTGYDQLTPGVKKAGNSYNASYIDHFADGTEGIYLGYSHTENPFQGKQWSAWGYPTAPDGNLVLGGTRIFSQTELLKRDGLVGVLESRPNDFIHSKIDLFYAQFDNNKLQGGMQIPMAVWSSSVLQPGYTVTNGLITSYTLTHVNPVLEELVQHWKDHVKSVVWNLDLGEKSDWPVSVQAGWSSAKRKQEVLETYAGLGFNQTNTNPATVTVSQTAGSNPAQVSSTTDFSNASLFMITDPQGWGVGALPITGQEGYIKFFSESDIADSVKTSIKHNLNLVIFKDLEIGVSYSERYKNSAQDPTGYLVNTNGHPTDPLPPLNGTTSLAYAGNLRVIGWNAEQLVTSKALTLVPNPNPGTFVGDNYKVWEKITRPYIKTDLKGTIAGMPFAGDLGAKADLTEQSSTGLSAGGGTLVSPASASATYATLLPALNLILKPSEEDIVRIFLGREEQRPRMYDMRASRNYGYDNTYATSTTITPWSGNSGNPNLKPWLADAIDLGYEHYFAKNQGYVSAAVFQKNLKTYIYQQNTLTDFTGYNYTSPRPPLIYQGYTSTNANGEGGKVRGLEATVQVTSELLTGGAVKGIGFVANGLLVDSDIRPWGPTGPTAPLPNLSKKSGNITLYYEAHGFSARVSMHYQSESRELIANLGVPTPSNYGTPNDGYSTETPFHSIDAQISYDFSRKSVLRGLSVYLDGRNLNDAALVQYNNGDSRQLMNWQKYGASYSAGVAYKF